MKPLSLILLGLGIFLLSCSNENSINEDSNFNLPPNPKIIVIGIDGLSPLAINEDITPIMAGLITKGAYASNARAVGPTNSSPNWFSMISGAGPEQHGVTSNNWTPSDPGFNSSYIGPRGMFPTIFGELRDNMPHLKTAIFHDWRGFNVLVEYGVTDHIEHTPKPPLTIEKAIDYFNTFSPDLMFLHLDDVDRMLHGFGFLTSNYYESVTQTDSLVGLLIEKIGANIFEKDTYLLITSDHGGKGKSHGGISKDEVTIPWLIVGPNIKKGYKINEQVYTYDTTATIAFILGLEQKPFWIAKPILEIFN